MLKELRITEYIIVSISFAIANNRQRPRLGEVREIAFRPHFAKPYVGGSACEV